MAVEIGKKAPAFTLKNAKGEKIALRDFAGEKNVVLYFYPKDNTPGCTKQAQSFRDLKAKFSRAKTVILGVSPDDEKSHQKFIEKFDLNFDLLVDVDHKIADKYGIWVEKNMYGRKYWGVQRATYLIGKDGKIAAMWPKVKLTGHVDEVYQTVKELF